MDAFCSVEAEEEWEEEEEEGSLSGSKMHGCLLWAGNTMCLAGAVEVRHSLKVSFTDTQTLHTNTHQSTHTNKSLHTPTETHTNRNTHKR